MSATDAAAVLERVESDEGFAASFEALIPDASAVIARLREDGYDVTEVELREAALDRYGALLTSEQLDQLAAGVDGAAVGVFAYLGAAGAAVGVGAAAIFFGII